MHSSISVYIDIKKEFKEEAVFTFENLLYPFFTEIIFFDNVEKFLDTKNKIIYCDPQSKILNKDKALENSIVIFLEKETLEFYKSFQDYDLKKIIYINSIPCLFPRKKKTTSKNLNVLPFDLIASSFFFLSCWQEYTIQERDSRNRIMFKSTIHNKLNLGRKPIVNLYLNIFEKHLHKYLNIKLIQKDISKGKKTFVALTHDLDVVEYSPLGYLKRLFDVRKYIHLTFKNIYYIFRNILGQSYILQKLEDVELKNNVRSSHYFLSEYPKKDKIFVDKYIKNLVQKSFEIGHHISNKSIFSNNLNEDKNLIVSSHEDIKGSRVHMLEFEIGPLFDQLEEEKYLYDTSLMFAEEFSYRTGFTYPHYIFNISKKIPYKTIEIPLNIMDISSNKYLHLNDKQFKKEILLFIDEGLKYGGAITLLFHNSYFFYNTESRLKMYDDLLSFLKEQKIPTGTCEQLYLWRKNLI